jgi:hypothetical protein
LLMMETGRPDSGKILLTRALELRNKFRDHVFIFDMARIHAALGNKKEAVQYFRETISSGYRDVCWFRHDPFMDYVRNEPEITSIFNELLEDNKNILKRIKELESLPLDLDRLQSL